VLAYHHGKAGDQLRPPKGGFWPSDQITELFVAPTIRSKEVFVANVNPEPELVSNLRLQELNHRDKTSSYSVNASDQFGGPLFSKMLLDGIAVF